jgi:hypothetical protein
MVGVRGVAGTVLAGLTGLAVASVPARADTFSLTISVPATAPVGPAFQVTGSGVDPIDQGALYLEIDEIPASFTTTCPAGYLDGGQLASSTGGRLVAFDELESFNADGSFSNLNAFTPTAPGQVLFCGYTDDGATDTLATASAVTTVVQPVAKPAGITRPRIRQSRNTLTCTRGRWSGSPTRFAYSWLVNGRRKSGAHRARLTVTRNLRGRRVRCSVTVSNSAGSARGLSPPFKVR